MTGVAYLVLAHTLPNQLLRLVRRLSTHPEDRVLVHIDRRFRGEFATVATTLERLENVALVSFRKVHWGHISVVDALLDCIGAILDRHPGVAHIKHLSGQDYPCQPVAAFRGLLAAHPGRSLMEFHALPNPIWTAGGEADGGVGRVTRPRVRIGRSTVRLPFRQRLPDGLRLHGGSALWCLSRAHAAYVVAEADRYRRLFRFATCPDELFFQTVLLNSRFGADVVNNGMTYVAWEHGAPSPKILTRDDLPAIVESGCWFARKFDIDRHPSVMDDLDRR